ncbi:unnamed protein product [Adineta steineri]|uniref:F-box domain-containing protein n=1 Tax=Adineta steineri TaxID=433720 RepID=A0A814BXA3_9BILA|nr:unnamed protein product [Adineta steineri]
MGRNSKSKNQNIKVYNKNSSLEHLSNEILYQICKHLDGYEAFYAFHDLNYRFDQFLKSLLFILNITSDTLKSKLYIREIFKEILNFHKNRIIVIYLDMLLSFNDLFSFNSSFNRLKILHLYNCQSNKFIAFLQNLTYLPDLSSLNLEICDQSINLNNIYQIILTLPKLKSCDIKTNNNPKFSSLLSMNQNLSQIERLDIRGHCDLNECLCIVSHTHQLSHLVYIQTNPIDYNIRINSPINLSNLTHLYLRISGMKFNVFENFLSQISCKLTNLCLTTEIEDMKYLDANHWENFLLENYSQLKIFQLKCYAKHNHILDPVKINQFLTSFWIERRWVLEINVSPVHFLYSITPYKKRWYDELSKEIYPSSSELKKSCQLTLTNIDSSRWNQIKDMFISAKIYHLVLLQEKTFIVTLIKIVRSLPKLISLQFNSLSFIEPNGEDFDDCFSKRSKSKIENVYVEKVETNGEIACISTLCPRMKCFRIISFENSTNSRSFYY